MKPHFIKVQKDLGTHIRSRRVVKRVKQGEFQGHHSSGRLSFLASSGKKCGGEIAAFLANSWILKSPPQLSLLRVPPHSSPTATQRLSFESHLISEI